MELSEFDALCDYIVKKNPFQRKFISRSIKDISQGCRDDANSYIRYCISQGDTISQMADAYLELVDEINNEQLYFARTGRYRFSTLAEVEEVVYKNQKYMRMYMQGLAITLFLWPQHRDIRKFFNTHTHAIRASIS